MRETPREGEMGQDTLRVANELTLGSVSRGGEGDGTCSEH